MKTIGMLGGMSWESTVSYYQIINQTVKSRLGGLHSAKICLISVDFDHIENLQRNGHWKQAAIELSNAAQSVEAGGADFLIICTNTMHKIASEIEQAISIPLLHIADSTGQQLRKNNIEKVGLIGTKFTMEQDFYRERLEQKYGVKVITPPESERLKVHEIIYSELCVGKINSESRAYYLNVIQDLQKKGAEVVILGCTEISMLVKAEDTHVPLYDTTTIHAENAVTLAIK